MKTVDEATNAEAMLRPVQACLLYTSNDYAQRTYKKRFFPQNASFLKRIEQTKNWYGSTFVSRPYIDLVDKSESPGYFEKLRRIWNQRDVLIVEGKYSRSGVGNNLFDNANSIKRILCPAKNSYEKIDQIEQAIRNNAQNRLILLMLGPDVYKRQA